MTIKGQLRLVHSRDDATTLANSERRAWDHYVEAAKKAQATRNFEDGIAAGRAWGRWLRLFERM